jgi:hypothetical protein
MRSPQNIKNQVCCCGNASSCAWAGPQHSPQPRLASSHSSAHPHHTRGHQPTHQPIPCRQVNYFNSKPEHVRDNRFLAARSTLEDLLAAEPDTVKHRRETLQDVLLKVGRAGMC